MARQTRPAREILAYDFAWEAPWVEAVLCKERVGAARLESWLGRHGDRVCWAEADGREGSGSVQVGWLEAKCPYCSREGSEQSDALVNGGWVTVPGCEEGLSVKRGQGERSGPFHVYCGHLPVSELNRVVPLVDEGLQHRLPGGFPNMASRIMCEARQMRLDFEGMPPARWRIGLEDDYAGTYRCPRCGGVFLVAYGWSLAEYAGRLWRRRAYPERPVKTAGANSPLRARVSLAGECLQVAVSGFGFERVVGFGLADGSLSLDGELVIRPGLFLGMPRDAAVEEAFADPDFYGAVARLIPAAVGVPQPDARRRSLDALALRNRFRGYPETFYDELIGPRRLHGSLAIREAEGLRLLPVDFADIDTAFRTSLLPPTKGVRRAVFERPTLLACVLSMRQLPFNNVDVLQSVLGHPLAREYLASVSTHTRFWSLLAECKGEVATWRFMSGLEPSAIGRLLNEWERAAHCMPREALARELKELPTREILGRAPTIGWESRHGKGSAHAQYEYREEQLALEGGSGGFDFVLPERPRDVLDAAVEMHNCLSGFADRIPERATVVFAVDRAAAKHGIAAAIEVDTREGRIAQAQRACSAPIIAGSSLDTALRAWAEARGLTLAS